MKIETMNQINELAASIVNESNLGARKEKILKLVNFINKISIEKTKTYESQASSLYDR